MSAVRKVYTTKSLSPQKLSLLRVMQEINYGRIENLQVRGGEPILDGHHRIVRAIKMKGESGPRPEVSSEEFALKIEVVELFRHLRSIGNGTVKVLEIKAGLPFLMEFEEAA